MSMIIVFERNPDYHIIGCGYCEATGKDPTYSSSSQKCPVCDGAGKVLKKLPYVECSYCTGKGKDPTYSSSSQKCPKCYGVGALSAGQLKVY